MQMITYKMVSTEKGTQKLRYAAFIKALERRLQPNNKTNIKRSAEPGKGEHRRNAQGW